MKLDLAKIDRAVLALLSLGRNPSCLRKKVWPSPNVSFKSFLPDWAARHAVPPVAILPPQNG